jgi:hypothetical protein
MSRSGAPSMRRPITRHRSEWVEGPVPGPLPAGMAEVSLHRRRVHDGTLTALRSRDLGELHLSVSWAGHSPRQAKRYPTWDELADARDALLPGDVAFVMVLPPAEEYVAVHDTTFHLHAAPPQVPPAEELERLAADLERVAGRSPLMDARPVLEVAELLRGLVQR